MMEKEYILGTHDEELERLGFQHRVWAKYAYSIWERSGFTTGQTLLDVGCGPGFATQDLSALVGPTGRVIAVDESEKFISYVKSISQTMSIKNIDARVEDVQKLDLPESSIDGAYARWVLCFVSEPEEVIQRVTRSLKPGGVFAVQDYFNYQAFTLAPKSPALDRVVQAVIRSWQKGGGDVDIAGRIPEMMERCGLSVREIKPIVRVARPGSALWNWPYTFFKIFLPVLIDMDLLTPKEGEAFLKEWHDRAENPNAFFMSPPILDIIGTKCL